MVLNTHTSLRRKHEISKWYDIILKFLKLTIIKSISLLLMKKLFKFTNPHILFIPRRSGLIETKCSQ